jgi:hypothetical protein
MASNHDEGHPRSAGLSVPGVSGVISKRRHSIWKKDSSHLVYKVLAVIVTKILGPDDAVEVSFHELLNKINFFKVR